MVTHDFERGVIRGLSRAAVDVVRRTGRLPADAVHPAMVEVWDAVAASRRYELPEPTMTDLRRLRDGGAGFGLDEREAFDGEAAPPGSDDFARMYAVEDCKDFTEGTGGPLGWPEDLRFEVPAAAYATECADEVSVAGVPYSEQWGTCSPPKWKPVFAEPETICADASEYAALFVECPDDVVDVMARGRCLLRANLDIVKWALCLAYGEERATEGVFAVYPRLVEEIDRSVATCKGRSASGVFAEAVFSVGIYERHEAVKAWADGLPAGGGDVEANRLCAAVTVAYMLFHEFMHVAEGITSADGFGDQVPCHHMHLAQSAVKWGLLARYRDARVSSCCDGCLSDRFWELPVGYPGTTCGPSGELDDPFAGTARLGRAVPSVWYPSWVDGPS